MSATLFLVPTALDVGTAEADADLGDRLPLGTLRVAARLGHWVCENAKTTRAFLKRVDAVCPLAQPIQSLAIVELPRPPKGRTAASPADLAPLLAPGDGEGFQGGQKRQFALLPLQDDPLLGTVLP